MGSSISTQTGGAKLSFLARKKFLPARTVSLILLSVMLGVVQGWALSRTYSSERQAGLRIGLLHGALMPAALPALVLGKDLPIYAANTTGRTYKIGYIVGLNLCGALFFGIAFRRPPGP
jgi:hypothetical protein